MAGGKETPRQKMIGMMYLVLTALLALQVSNTVLDKFMLIDEGLSQSASLSRSENQQLMRQIQEAVAKRKGKSEDLHYQNLAEELMSETEKVLTEIESFRSELIEATGGIDEEGNYVGASSDAEVMSIALGPGDSKDGRAYTLKEVLDAYRQKVNSLDTGLSIGPLAQGADEIERYQGTEHENKDFARLNFQNTPTVAALAVLNQIKTEVIKNETRALEMLASHVGADELAVDRVIPVVSPESKVVPLGTPYRANMMVAAYSSVAKPSYETSVGDVNITENGQGQIEFIAAANDFDASGKARRVWTGTITLKTPSGDTTFTVEEEYFVSKPTMQVSAGAVSSLYLNCGNKLNVQVPELGANYDPQFNVSGGDVIKSAQKGQITIVPSKAKVDMVVNNNGYFIGKESFKVRRIPKPTIKVFSGNRELDLRNGGSAPRRLNLRVIPDPDFAEFSPQDARYRVTKWEFIIARGSRPVERQTFDDPDVDIGRYLSSAQPGDRIVIDIKEVKRRNFRDKLETVDMGYQIFNYTLK